MKLLTVIKISTSDAPGRIKTEPIVVVEMVNKKNESARASPTTPKKTPPKAIPAYVAKFLKEHGSSPTVKAFFRSTTDPTKTVASTPTQPTS